MAAKSSVLANEDTGAGQTSRQGQFVHKPFLLEYFGTNPGKPQLHDENLEHQLKTLNKKFAEQSNILNALKCSFQKEKNDWNIERTELHRIINELSENRNYDHKVLNMERGQNFTQKIEFEMASSIMHEKYIKAKEQIINFEIENSMLNIKLAAVENANKNFISTRFQDSLATIPQSPCINTIQHKNTAVKSYAINCTPKSCNSCDDLKSQIKSMVKIIESQNERIMERNAKMKLLELGTEKPTLLRSNVLKSKSSSISPKKEQENSNTFDENSRLNENFKTRNAAVKDLKNDISYNHPDTFSVNISLNDFINTYTSIKAGETKKNDEVRVSGQVYAIRAIGPKLIFYDLRGSGRRVQIMASASKYNGSESVFSEDTEKLRKGDLIGVVGYPGKSEKGDLSVIPTKLVLLEVQIT